MILHPLAADDLVGIVETASGLVLSGPSYLIFWMSPKKPVLMGVFPPWWFKIRVGGKAPSSACRHLLPDGEKRFAAASPFPSPLGEKVARRVG
jgi:hypothetical protein